jgi:hypothetical protein
MERKSKLLISTVAGAVIISLGAIFYTSKDDTKDLKAKTEACEFLDGKNDELSKHRFEKFNRLEALRNLREILQCANRGDVNEFKSKYRNACEYINKGLKANSPRWKHPILNPFYTSLNEAICSMDIPSSEEDAKKEFQFLRDLKSNLAERIKPVNPDVKIAEICSPIFEIIRNRDREISIIISYIVNSAHKFPKDGELLKFISKLKTRLKEENVDENDVANIQKLLDRDIAAATISSTKSEIICAMPIEGILKIFAKKLTPARIDDIRRKEVLPLVLELIEFALKDETVDGKKAIRSLVYIAKDLENVK